MIKLHEYKENNNNSVKFMIELFLCTCIMLDLSSYSKSFVKFSCQVRLQRTRDLACNPEERKKLIIVIKFLTVTTMRVYEIQRGKLHERNTRTECLATRHKNRVFSYEAEEQSV